MGLRAIEGELEDFDERTLPWNPIVGALRHQHDDNPDLRRRRARHVIVDHFSGGDIEQQCGERWTA